MTIIQQRPMPLEAFHHLHNAGVSPLLARLFAARGVADIAEISLSLNHLLPPSGLANSDTMARLLADAIEARKKLLVVGDYDADGATATAVAIKGLRAFGAKVDFLVPNRFEYGYGLTPEIVALAAGYQPDIIITVDNGIASVDGVAAANTLGIRVLITDHHLPGKETPQAACIVNPNQHGCPFASKHLAGVGVMFYCLLALRAEFRARGTYEEKPEPNLTGLLDLVALGTVADLVKLDYNNRILVEQGLRRIRAGAGSPGVSALLRISGRNPMIATAQDLGFYAGPRLNAAGRLDDMTLGIQCLLAESEAEALGKAQALHALNQERRSIEADMQDSANIALDDANIDHQYSITMFHPEWHQGVIGILASRLKERHHRPVIVFADAGAGLVKGSGRSITGLHLRDALDLLSKHHPNLILKFGGHAMAAGLTIRREHLELFKQGFETVVRSLITEADLQSVLEVDGSLGHDDMSLENARLLEGQVWGQHFPVPIFYDEFEVMHQRILSEKHLKMILKPIASMHAPVVVQADSTAAIDAIYFNHTHVPGQRIRAAYQLQTNSYKGVSKVQLNLQFVTDCSSDSRHVSFTGTGDSADAD